MSRKTYAKSKTLGSSYARFTDERRVHWDFVAETFVRKGPFARVYHRRLIRTYKALIPEGSRVLELGCGKGDLLATLKPSYGVGVDFSRNMINVASSRHKGENIHFYVEDAHDVVISETFDYIILSDLIDDLWDVEAVLRRITDQVDSATVILINSYSLLWEPLLRIARKFRLATPLLRQNLLSPHDIVTLAHLSRLDLNRRIKDVLLPVPIPLLTNICNRYLARSWPFYLFSMCNVYVFRPERRLSSTDYSVSIVVPARNEAGHIASIIDRTPNMGHHTELIFVEGNSTDCTRDVIQTEIAKRPKEDIRLLVQDGKGKKDAVTKGFQAAKGDVLMILDADMTVMPEELPKFFTAYIEGRGDMINGVRLSYPMAAGAMRPLNFFGNRVFSALNSWIIGQKVQDTLCGTKVLSRHSYQATEKHRTIYEAKDPFGDFELIYGAAAGHLKICDLPIRYQDRAYGTTNINRWRHGAQLFKVLVEGVARLKYF